MEQAFLKFPDLRGDLVRGTGSSYETAAKQVLGQLTQDRLERDLLLLPSSQHAGKKSSGYGQRRLSVPKGPKAQQALTTLGTGMLARALSMLDKSGSSSAASSTPCSPKFHNPCSPKSTLTRSSSCSQLSPANQKAATPKCTDVEAQCASEYGCSEQCYPVAPPAGWMDLLPEPVRPKQSQDHLERSSRRLSKPFASPSEFSLCLGSSCCASPVSPCSDNQMRSRELMVEALASPVSPCNDKRSPCSDVRQALFEREELLPEKPQFRRVQPGSQLAACRSSSGCSSRPFSAPLHRPDHECSLGKHAMQRQLAPDTEQAWASGVLRYGPCVMERQETLLEWVDHIVAEDSEPQQRQPTAHKSDQKATRHGEEVAQKKSKWQVAKMSMLQSKAMKRLKMKMDSGGGGPVSDREAATLSELPPLDPRVLDEIFDELQKNCEIRTDQLPEALGKLEKRSVRMEWVEEIVEKLLSNRSFLDRSEFVKLCTMYQTYKHRFLMDIFREVDIDDSHTISVAEVSILLNRRGISPMPGFVEELFRAITGETKLRDISFEEFAQIYDTVHMQAGFTEQELEKLQNIWSRFDANGNGTFDCDEIRAALRWEGFAVDDRMMKTLVQEVAPDEGSLQQEQYLALVRRYREEELLFRRRHPHYEGRTISRDALPLVLSGLGYTSASPEVIEEAVDSVFETTKISAAPASEHNTSDCHEKADLTFDDLYLLLGFVRESQGFLKAERAEMHAAFSIACKDELATHGDTRLLAAGIETGDLDLSAGLNVIQITSVLRWLGYPAIVWKVQELLESLDLGDVLNITRDDFMKLMGRLRNRELTCIRRRLGSNGQVAAGNLKRILRDLGYMMTLPNVDKLLRDYRDMLSGNPVPWGIHRMLRKYREATRNYFAQNHGFNRSEVVRLQTAFARLDAKGTDKLAGKAFSQFLKELFPGIDQTREDQQKARQLLHMVLGPRESSSQWEVNFQDFVHLIRLRTNQRMSEWVSEERRQMQACEFSASEVKEFRLLFNQAAVKEPGESTVANSSDFTVGNAVVPSLSLSHAAIKKMMTRVTGSCNDAGSRALSKLLRNVDAENRGALNFGQFLRAVRDIINANWHNINIEAESLAMQWRQQQQ
eukprot:TRINITY_DN10238_c0_g1_i1.p1 TRINITY_DN10238_c0_g1~~TRINITY_DN10238_c0_g1_i1.p1  ORF type:complete len:1117 (+),score=221.53 TRINITY_DN10238_c0_g1_i1:170-3520(+)